jgi:DNA-directed RNA polymerase subunit RPC12/RpoP
MSEVMARRPLAGNIPAGKIVEVKAGNIAEANSADERVHCEDCGSDEVYRLVRKGFLESKIYPLFGIYPWRCKGCGLRLMMRKRGMAREQELKLPETQERKKLRARNSTLAGRSANRLIK